MAKQGLHVYDDTRYDCSALGLGRAEVQPTAFCGKRIYWTTPRQGATYVAKQPELYRVGACPTCWEIFTEAK